MKKIYVSGVALENYKIVCCENDLYGARLFAKRLSLLLSDLGYDVPVVCDCEEVSECEIVVGSTNRTNEKASDTAYTVSCAGSKLFFHSPYSAGYQFLYDKVASELQSEEDTCFIDGQLISTELATLLSDGSEHMLGRKGSVRILYNNIWDVRKDNETAPFALRSKQLVDVYRDYAPDVIALQEADGDMYKLIGQGITEVGYVEAPCPPMNYIAKDFNKSNAIFYNPKTLSVVKSGSYLLKPETDLTKIPRWAMRMTPWAIFEEIATGKRFCLANNHYTWVPDFEQACAYRIEDAKSTSYLVNKLAEEEGLPVIIGGDFNSFFDREPEPIRILKDGGLVDLRDLAKKADRGNTHHTYPIFDVNTGVCVKHFYPQGTCENAIDHVFAHSADNVVFHTFAVIKDWFALASSDHCPMVTDITIN